MKPFLFILTTLFTFSLCATAQKPVIFQTDGKAVKGYDVVAFFTDSSAVPGTPQYSYDWSGATWQFVSKAHLDSFKLAPKSYAPQFGGYCAYGCAMGHKSPTETDTWTLLNGKLYFNYNQKVKTAWLKNQQATISKADSTWATLKDQ